MTATIASTIPLIILGACLDRLRGSAKISRIGSVAVKAQYGWIVAVAMGHVFDWQALAITALFAVGISWGWGTPLGDYIYGTKADRDPDDYEWWQVGPLKEHYYAALVVRGFMLGSPLCVINIDAGIGISLAFFVAPALIVVAKSIKEDAVNDWWAANEYLRGAIVVAAALVSAGRDVAW